MNKSELIDAIAADAGITKSQAKDALDSFTSNVTKALAKGDRVSLVGFGSFSTSERSARDGINPQTKEKMHIPAKTVAKFKAGSELANSVNNK
ncbi:DNA-binding protein [Flavobacteriaceae bacterium Ap0902]|nr:DNA-binding protein [Flavobacteriaceae bacterium Ap0902]